MKCNFISSTMSLDILEVASLYFESIDTAVSLSCYILLRNNELESLINKTIDPLSYNSSESFRRDYLAVKFLSKYDSFDIVDRDEAAMLAFRNAEQLCSAANMRLDSGSLPGVVASVFHRAHEKLSKSLPMFDSSTLQEIVDRGRFGPGVTSSCKGDYTGIYNKFSSENDITPNCARFLERLAPFIELPPHFQSYREVRGNRITTVPKNSKTNRTIAVEPHVNAYLQRGVGLYLRDKLLEIFRIDLRDQANNQKAALAASIDGEYVTVDLAAASDTVSIEIVRRLLPDHWITLLEALRSEWYNRDGQWFQYRKHSSMGNGYTFELESIIFTSLVYAVYTYLGIDKRYYVYGDDIIVHKSAYPLLLEVLTFAGFSINESKTHSRGYFRESCGCDAFHGTDVTPFYFKKGDDVVQVITFANWLQTTALPFSITKLWKYLYFSVPKAWANKGPRNGEGVHFYVDPYLIPDSLVRINKYGRWVYRYTSVIFRPVKRSVDDSYEHLRASLKLLDMMNPDAGVTYNMRLHRSVLSDDFPSYNRQSVGRRKGSWFRKSVVLWGDWPMVR